LLRSAEIENTYIRRSSEMKNIQYKPRKKPTPWRKVSMASWKPAGDSSTYCLEDISMEVCLEHCKANQININSFLIKALSNTIEKHPKINSTVRWWNIRQRQDISIFFHTTKDAKTDDLSGILIENGQKKPISELNQEFFEKIELSKTGETEHNQSKKIVGILPAFFAKPLMDFYAFIVYTLNRNLGFFKSPRNAFGSIMLTATGSIGLAKSICPIAPYTRVPMVISFGLIEKRPVVIEDKLEIKKMSTFGFTFDHRIMDGIHFQEFLSCFRNYILHPNLIENG